MKKTLLLIVFLFVCLTAAGCGPALVVDSAGDEPDSNLSDGVCKTVNNDCTLRAAIMEAELSDDISKITFDSNFTISPTTDLPPLTANNTQILGEGKTIVLDGSGITQTQSTGIRIEESHNNIIQGLRIQNFLYGIFILGDISEAKNNTIGMAPSSTSGADEHNVLVNNYIGLVIEGEHARDNVVSGNYIGIEGDGVTPQQNVNSGINIRKGADHNLIGSLTGDTVSTGGNLISGNGNGIKIRESAHNHISGNYIGTDESGTAAVSNGNGISIQWGSSNNKIGLAYSGEGQPNLISGNNSEGIIITDSSYTEIAGNYIGVNVAGTSALSNRFGIYMTGDGFNIIGTNGDGVNDPNEGNLISGNTHNGIIITKSNSIYNTIAGNLIGTNFDGSGAIGNAGSGISTAGHNTIIGTDGDGVSDVQEGNLISGNGGLGILLASNENIVAGNIIGLDLTGSTAIPNTSSGITINQDSSLNLIGTNGDGTADDLERNIISGNGGGQFSVFGINIVGSENIIAGNFIGTDITGMTSLSDHQTGIGLTSSSNNNLIGTDSDGTANQAEGNLISGNGYFGIEILGSSFNQISGNLIGTDLSGTSAVPNGFISPQYYHGAVQLEDGSTNNIIGTDGDGLNDPGEGNLISGNAIKGIVILGSNIFNNVVAGNKIGTDISGGAVLGNTAGIEIMQGAEYTRIGTNGDGLSDHAEANIISGNGDFGIRIDSPGNVIQGNYIGTDLTGTSDLGNGTHGILINNNALGVGIGGSLEKANTIAFNKRAGIYVRKIYPNDPNDPNNVIITFNSIYSNAEEGIDLDDATQTGSTPNDSGDVDTGPNDFMNYPELNYAQSITPTLTITGEIIDGLPNTQFEIQFFSNPVCDSPSNHGEGKNYLGSSIQQTDGNGNVQFLVSFPATVAPGSFITSTATTNGKTSEFSGCVEVQEAQTYSQELEENPCDQFDPEEMTITTFEVRQDSGQFILYVKNPFPYPETTGENEWEYTATLGEIPAIKCDSQGFENRKYCDFFIPPEYYNTKQTLKLFSNLCIPPFYINEEVTIFAKDPVGPAAPDEPEGCHSDLGQRACSSAGGNYSPGIGVPDTCICP